MKKNAFSLFIFALIGIGIGIPVTLTCMACISGFNGVIMEFLVWTVASALFGLISGLIFHCCSEMKLPVAMALHCVGCMAVAMGACLLCGYASSLTELLVSILPVFVIVYVLVFAFVVIIMKINEKQINEALNKK